MKLNGKELKVTSSNMALPNVCNIHFEGGLSISIAMQTFLRYKRATITVRYNGGFEFRKVRMPLKYTSSTKAYLDGIFDDVIYSMVAELQEVK